MTVSGPRGVSETRLGSELVGGSTAIRTFDSTSEGNTRALARKVPTAGPPRSYNGGTLDGPDGSCTPVSSLDPDFVAGARAATPGTPSEPVQTQFGWHVILVEEFQQAAFDEMKESVRRDVAYEADQELGRVLVEALGVSDVWVNPK